MEIECFRVYQCVNKRVRVMVNSCNRELDRKGMKVGRLSGAVGSP